MKLLSGSARYINNQSRIQLMKEFLIKNAKEVRYYISLKHILDDIGYNFDDIDNNVIDMCDMYLFIVHSIGYTSYEFLEETE